MDLKKIRLSNAIEHKNFKLPFDNKNWKEFNNYLKYLIECRKNVSIKMIYDNDAIRETKIICETN